MSNCFTAETAVLVPGETAHVAIAAATEDANHGGARRALLAGACLVVGAGGWGILMERAGKIGNGPRAALMSWISTATATKCSPMP